MITFVSTSKIFLTEYGKPAQFRKTFRDALLVNLYKNKGNASDCGNYRGIALLSVGGKVLTKAMANRLTSVLERILPEAQSGFRPNRGTSDAVFILRQLQEKALEQQESIYMAFTDLTKAFDSVDRSLLWKIMTSTGYTTDICERVTEPSFKQLCMQGYAIMENLSNYFQWTLESDRCVLAPLLFNLSSSVLTMLVDRKLSLRGISMRVCSSTFAIQPVHS